MGSVSFVHCSDLHLGNMQYNRLERFEDFGRAFAQIVDYAIENRADFFLISGDLFNKRNINAGTLIQATDILDRLRRGGISTLAIEGNHDKAFRDDRVSWMQFLAEKDYIKLLKPDFRDGEIYLNKWDSKSGAYIETDDIRIYGVGYLGATTGQRISQIVEQIENDGKFTVLMLHAAIQSMARMEIGGVKLDEIAVLKDRVDYLALGHLHHRNELDDWAFNPGAPECWDIAEAEYEKGFYHVHVEGCSKDVRFIQSKRREALRKEIDISGSPDPSEVERRIWESIDLEKLDCMDKPIVQLTLNGRIDFNPTDIDEDAIKNRLKNEYGCMFVDVINNANLFIGKYNKEARIDRDYIERGVLHELVQQSAKFRDAGDEMVDLILKIKDMALSGSDVEEIIELVYSKVESGELDVDS